MCWVHCPHRIKFGAKELISDRTFSSKLQRLQVAQTVLSFFKEYTLSSPSTTGGTKITGTHPELTRSGSRITSRSRISALRPTDAL
jgi:hypothetical protein